MMAIARHFHSLHNYRDGGYFRDHSITMLIVLGVLWCTCVLTSKTED